MQEQDYAYINIGKATIEPVKLKNFTNKQVSVEVLRLDKIHPVVSGNKWFKLKHYLKQALANQYTSLLTYGGAWSNHIVATAFAAQQAGMKSTGLIRGEEPLRRSQTLVDAERYGMDIQFIGRFGFGADFDSTELATNYGDPYIIPEGGRGKAGVEGCSEILSLAEAAQYSHVMCCIGSGTMYAGLINASPAGQQVIGIPVLKGFKDLQASLAPFITHQEKTSDCTIIDGYHFGGYAKKTPDLLQFMNRFFEATGIPLDFVYTGKLFYACIDLINKDYFPQGSSILLIHSGGLQGNSSLPEGTLKY